MIVAGMAAGDIGVQAFDLVSEAGFLKKIERAIDGRGLGRAFAVQIGQQIIRFGGLRALQQQAEHLAANTRHPLSLAHDEGFCLIDKGFHVLRAAGGICVNVTV